MVIKCILLSNKHLTNIFVLALRILAAIKYREPVDFAEFVWKRIKKNITFWQEGKEHEIIYPRLIQLLIKNNL